MNFPGFPSAASRRVMVLLLVWSAGGLAFVGAEEPPPPPTVIEADVMELRSSEAENRFFFRKNVRVFGTNLLVSCDELTVVSARSGDPAATVGELGALQSIVATGNVDIVQAGRRATAGRAELFPREGKVVLTEQPVIIDERAEVRGWRITLLQGERSGIVESAPPGTPGGGRATTILDALPDLGFAGQPRDEDAEAATDEDAAASPEPPAAEMEAAPLMSPEAEEPVDPDPAVEIPIVPLPPE